MKPFGKIYTLIFKVWGGILGCYTKIDMDIYWSFIHLHGGKVFGKRRILYGL